MLVHLATITANQDSEPAHTVISSDAVLMLMLGVGIVLTLALIGFFSFVIWNESRKDREQKSGNSD